MIKFHLYRFKVKYYKRIKKGVKLIFDYLLFKIKLNYYYY